MKYLLQGEYFSYGGGGGGGGGDDHWFCSKIRPHHREGKNEDANLYHNSPTSVKCLRFLYFEGIIKIGFLLLMVIERLIRWRRMIGHYGGGCCGGG